MSNKKKKKIPKIKKLLLKSFSNNIINIIFSYSNQSYNNLHKLYKKRCNNPVKDNYSPGNILDILAKCCSLGYSGFCVDGTDKKYKERLRNYSKRYNNIIENIVNFQGKEIFKLKNIDGTWIHIFCLCDYNWNN